ncbi:MAG: hypothetical protein JWP38_3670 [Herbaspirillum sp.]|nr:hypothetical protein [Herbaspirillum sp.]
MSNTTLLVVIYVTFLIIYLSFMHRNFCFPLLFFDSAIGGKGSGKATFLDEMFSLAWRAAEDGAERTAYRMRNTNL